MRRPAYRAHTGHMAHGARIWDVSGLFEVVCTRLKKPPEKPPPAATLTKIEAPMAIGAMSPKPGLETAVAQIVEFCQAGVFQLSVVAGALALAPGQAGLTRTNVPRNSHTKIGA